MFALNLGYSHNLATAVEGLNGVVLLPTENFSNRLGVTSEFPKILLDPQLYLAELPHQSCGSTCARLASYRWFQVSDIPELSSGMKVKEWQDQVKQIASSAWKSVLPPDVQRSCRDAISFQVQARCSHIILPSPLVRHRENEAALQATWLDAALEAASDLDPTQPLVATVALDENVINDAAFLPAGFLDTVVDQVTSRSGIEGVYIVIALTQKEHPFATSRKVNQAYFHLTKKFSDSGITSVFVNFADVFGLVCAAAGATMIASGQSQSSRRLCLRGFEDASFGRALPRFYSNRTISEYLSETEMRPIGANNLVRRVEDPTPFGNSLLHSLEGGPTPPEWAESQNNMTAAYQHFIQSLINFGGKLKSSTDRRAMVVEWLEDAEMYQSLLLQKLGASFPERRAPIDQWLEIVRSNPI